MHEANEVGGRGDTSLGSGMVDRAVPVHVAHGGTSAQKTAGESVHDSAGELSAAMSVHCSANLKLWSN